MEEFVKSFTDKICLRGKTPQRDSQPKIISRSNPHVGSGQPLKRPRHVSIGPLYHGDPSLQNMEDYKWWLMYLSNIGSLRFEQLSDCFSYLRKVEDTSRKMYSVTVDLTSDEFVQMLFLDVFFIILRVMADLQKQPPNLSTQNTNLVPVYRSRNLLPATERMEVEKNHPLLSTDNKLFDFDELTLIEIDIDLIMLDNQIPFFIIEYIWEWLGDKLNMKSSVDLFGHLRMYFQVPDHWCFPEKIHHLLHFLHCSIIAQPFIHCEKQGRKHWIPSAVVELKEVGIKVRINTSPRSFLDIKFVDGVIQLPKIYITGRQRLRLENLVDFEQSVCGIRTDFTTFLRFMSCLLSKEEDVRIISLQGIFENQLGSDKEVQHFFQNLHQRCGYCDPDTFLDGLCIGINNYRQSRRRRWKASFHRKYCSNPWITLSVAGAIVLFILTFLQTFFTVYSFFHLPSR